MDKDLEKQCRAEWAVVCDAIHARATATRPKPLSFEVYHESEVARNVFLTTVYEGDTPRQAKEAALRRIKLPVVRSFQERLDDVVASRKERKQQE